MPTTHRVTDDGVGFYKGNFGNMFFLWDVIFGTGHISRQYPKEYGISHYEGDPWYAQLLGRSSNRIFRAVNWRPMVR